MNFKLLLDKYVNACLLRKEAMKNFKPEVANKYYDETVEYYKSLKESDSLKELRPLLYHENNEVKLTAATHLLAIDEIVAKEVITQIMESEKGEIAFTAKMTLKEWNNGGMKLFR